jgi:glucose-6-phosphate 1-dehydrogenase
MPKIIPVAIFDCVVFGATGDLTLRKLLPALYYRFRDGQMPPESRVIGAARSKLTDEDFRVRATKALEHHVAPDDQEPEIMHRFLAQLHYVSIDATATDADWSRFDAVLDADRVRVFYLATSPDLYGPVCQALSANGLVMTSPRPR